MYTIRYTNKFRKDLKRCVSRGRDPELLREVLSLLSSTGTLPARYRRHKLVGNFKDRMECHIQPDWLLVWEQHDRELVMIMTDTGTHADIFE
jgi:mRNA interferase YafQ